MRMSSWISVSLKEFEAGKRRFGERVIESLRWEMESQGEGQVRRG